MREDTVVEESDLIQGSKTGDADAFDQLVGVHQDRVYQLAYRITGNREDAWDAAQEAFLRAYRSLRLFRGTASFSTWLHRIAVNTALDIVRRRPPQRSQPLDEAVALVGDDPADQVQRKDLQRRIHHAIASLPVDHRVVVILRDLEGLAYDEIAKLLTIPVGTVRSRLSRGRDALRTMLADVAPAGGTPQWKANG